MATIQDIAKKAGVSPGLVSLALNGKPRVSPDTAKKIIDIADSLGYRRRTTKTPGAGIVRFIHFAPMDSHLLGSHSPFYADYINGAQTNLQKMGYRCEVSSHPMTELPHACRILNHDGIQGAIVLATELSAKDIQVFETCGLPVVFLDAMYDHLTFDCCNMNNIDAIHMIVSALHDLGHRKIGLVNSSPITPNLEARTHAFATSLEQLGLSGRSPRVYTAPLDAALAAGKLQDDFRRRRPPPALVCITDSLAYGCLQALSSLGINVPEDVSVIGFDDLPSSPVMNPPLSSVQVPTAHMGAAAARLLDARIVTPDKPVEKVQFNCELILRASHADKRRNA